MKLLTAATPNQRKADRGPAHQRLRGDHDRRAAAGAARHVLHHRLCGRAGHHGLRSLVEVLARPFTGIMTSGHARSPHARTRTHACTHARMSARASTRQQLRPSFPCAHPSILPFPSALSMHPRPLLSLLSLKPGYARVGRLSLAVADATPSQLRTSRPFLSDGWNLFDVLVVGLSLVALGPVAMPINVLRWVGVRVTERKVLKPASCDVSRFSPRFDRVFSG